MCFVFYLLRQFGLSRLQWPPLSPEPKKGINSTARFPNLYIWKQVLKIVFFSVNEAFDIHHGRGNNTRSNPSANRDYQSSSFCKHSQIRRKHKPLKGPSHSEALLSLRVLFSISRHCSVDHRYFTFNTPSFAFTSELSSGYYPHHSFSTGKTNSQVELSGLGLCDAANPDGKLCVSKQKWCPARLLRKKERQV